MILKFTDGTDDIMEAGLHVSQFLWKYQSRCLVSTTFSAFQEGEEG